MARNFPPLAKQTHKDAIPFEQFWPNRKQDMRVFNQTFGDRNEYSGDFSPFLLMEVGDFFVIPHVGRYVRKIIAMEFIAHKFKTNPRWGNPDAVFVKTEFPPRAGSYDENGELTPASQRRLIALDLSEGTLIYRAK